MPLTYIHVLDILVDRFDDTKLICFELFNQIINNVIDYLPRVVYNRNKKKRPLYQNTIP